MPEHEEQQHIFFLVCRWQLNNRCRYSLRWKITHTRACQISRTKKMYSLSHAHASHTHFLYMHVQCVDRWSVALHICSAAVAFRGRGNFVIVVRLFSFHSAYKSILMSKWVFSFVCLYSASCAMILTRSVSFHRIEQKWMQNNASMLTNHVSSTNNCQIWSRKQPGYQLKSMCPTQLALP